MTYDVLNKTTKADIIDWMRRNVLLPNITDEQFLKDVKLNNLLKRQEELLKMDESLIAKMDAASKADKQFEFMRLMVESDKLNKEISDISNKVDRLIGIAR